MRKLKILFATLGILGLALLPAAGATFQLGAALGHIEAMHGRHGPPVDLELVGTYEVDPATNDAFVRVRPVAVRRFAEPGRGGI